MSIHLAPGTALNTPNALLLSELTVLQRVRIELGKGGDNVLMRKFCELAISVTESLIEWTKGVSKTLKYLSAEGIRVEDTQLGTTVMFVGKKSRSQCDQTREPKGRQWVRPERS